MCVILMIVPVGTGHKEHHYDSMHYALQKGPQLN